MTVCQLVSDHRVDRFLPAARRCVLPKAVPQETQHISDHEERGADISGDRAPQGGETGKRENTMFCRMMASVRLAWPTNQGSFEMSSVINATSAVSIERIRRKLASTDDGNRQMVDILNAVLTDGLPPASRRSLTASIPPMSFSTSWPASEILRHQPTSSPRLR